MASQLEISEQTCHNSMNSNFDGIEFCLYDTHVVDTCWDKFRYVNIEKQPIKEYPLCVEFNDSINDSRKLHALLRLNKL